MTTVSCTGRQPRDTTSIVPVEMSGKGEVEVGRAWLGRGGDVGDGGADESIGTGEDR